MWSQTNPMGAVPKDPWICPPPDPLPPKEEKREQSAALALSTKSLARLEAATQESTQQVLTYLREFKEACTLDAWPRMREAAEELERPVRVLRVCVRASNLKCSSSVQLPPHAAQYAGAKHPAGALAWTRALDSVLLDAGHNIGPLIKLWGNQVHKAPLAPALIKLEQHYAAILRANPNLLDPSPVVRPSKVSIFFGQKRPQETFAFGALLDLLRALIEPETGRTNPADTNANFYRITQTVGRLRGTLLAIASPDRPISMAPHPEEYCLAGNHWTANRELWGDAFSHWLTAENLYAPPAYDKGETLPPYEAFVGV